MIKAGPTAESDRPPASAQPRDDGWRPAEDDDGDKAVAWRARRGLDIARSLRVEIKDLRTSIDSLSLSVGTLTGVVNATKGLFAWMIRIIGTSAVLGIAAWIWSYVSTLHH